MKNILNKIFKKENIYIIISFPIWFPITVWKFGLIKSDNILTKLVKK